METESHMTEVQTEGSLAVYCEKSHCCCLVEGSSILQKHFTGRFKFHLGGNVALVFKG